MESVGVAQKTGKRNRPTVNEGYKGSGNEIWGVVGPMYFLEMGVDAGRNRHRGA